MLLSELIDGPSVSGGSFVLNSGDAGLLRSLARVSAEEASRAVDAGATIAAHARHVTIGLHLLNRWASDGGDPYADPMWDEAWRISRVTEAEWRATLGDLEREARQWLEILRTPRDVTGRELPGMIGTIAHVAYHLGAMRQIAKSARGPREGTFIVAR
jgi:hypothetical protein